jgi:hypothetical protein
MNNPFRKRVPADSFELDENQPRFQSAHDQISSQKPTSPDRLLRMGPWIERIILYLHLDPGNRKDFATDSSDFACRCPFLPVDFLR